MSDLERGIIVRTNNIEIYGRGKLPMIPLPSSVDLSTSLTAASQGEAKFSDVIRLADEMSCPEGKVRAYIEIAYSYIMAKVDLNYINTIIKVAEGEIRTLDKESRYGSSTSNRDVTNLLIDLGHVCVEAESPMAEGLLREAHERLGGLPELSDSLGSAEINIEKGSVMDKMMHLLEDTEKLADVLLIRKDLYPNFFQEVLESIKDAIHDPNYIFMAFNGSTRMEQNIKIINKLIELQVFSGDIISAASTAALLEDDRVKIELSPQNKFRDQQKLELIRGLSTIAAAQRLLGSMNPIEKASIEELEATIIEENLDAVFALGYSRGPSYYYEFSIINPSDEMRKKYLEGAKKRIADDRQKSVLAEKLIEAEIGEISEKS